MLQRVCARIASVLRSMASLMPQSAKKIPLNQIDKSTKPTIVLFNLFSLVMFIWEALLQLVLQVIHFFGPQSKGGCSAILCERQ